MTDLTDAFGRTVNYLRISVTDRCDFRCVYCMSEDMQFVPRQQLLTIEEITRIAATFTQLGIKKIRVTGGEPLIRRNIMQVFRNLNALEGLDELTLTTNGSHLQQYAKPLWDYGVRRINISLDSLNPDRFHQLTRTGDLQKVLKGIEAAQSTGMRVKLNCVILRSRNRDEVVDLVNFAIAQGCDISFIEEMPLGEINSHERFSEYVSTDETKSLIEQEYSLSPAKNSRTDGPSRYWQPPHSDSKIGFISPHSHNFCGDCNRVRLTATGKLLLCLGNEHSVDLKAVMRNYPTKEHALADAIVQSMHIKPEKHEFNLEEPPQILRFMNTTGG